VRCARTGLQTVANGPARFSEIGAKKPINSGLRNEAFEPPGSLSGLHGGAADRGEEEDAGARAM
jgi:hypothetical protein